MEPIDSVLVDKSDDNDIMKKLKAEMRVYLAKLREEEEAKKAKALAETQQAETQQAETQGGRRRRKTSKGIKKGGKKSRRRR